MDSCFETRSPHGWVWFEIFRKSNTLQGTYILKKAGEASQVLNKNKIVTGDTNGNN